MMNIHIYIYICTCINFVLKISQSMFLYINIEREIIILQPRAGRGVQGVFPQENLTKCTMLKYY